MTRQEAYLLALGYACGREDAGDTPLRGGVSRFTQAYANRCVAHENRYNAGMPSVRAAYEAWVQSGGQTIDPL